MSKRKRPSSKSVVKSLVTSSLSCRAGVGVGVRVRVRVRVRRARG